MSPALSYSGKHLHGDVDKEKKEKLPKEFEEDKLKREEEKRGACFKYILNQHFSTVWSGPKSKSRLCGQFPTTLLKGF